MIRGFLILLIVGFFAPLCAAVDFSVMTFNVMCDFCHKVEADVYSKRKNFIQATLQSHRSDLIALQEVRLGSQVEELFKDMSEYELFYTDSLLMSYADPAIAVNKKKFEVLDHGNFWLGPREGKFTLGWKLALPRQTLWVKVKSLEDDQTFIFITSHFDNRVENLLGAAKMLEEFVKAQREPVIFAADTNTTRAFEGYKNLNSKLVNAYDIKENFSVEGEAKSEKDMCYPRKGSEFPACAVDHVLLSKDTPWKVREWTIDLRRFGKQSRFASDHRAIVAKISL